MANSLEAMRGYYVLHCLTRRKHGVPPQPFSFFQNIVEHLFQTGHGFIMEARREDKLVAAGIFLHHGRNAIYKFGASDPAELNLRGNDLVMWEAIQWFASRGFASFSMGRSAATGRRLCAASSAVSARASRQSVITGTICAGQNSLPGERKKKALPTRCCS